MPLLRLSHASAEECPKCAAEYMYFVGDGAERVEEYLREQFPQARIARLDRDTVRTKREYQQFSARSRTGKSTSWWARRWWPRATISSASRWWE